MAHSVLLSLVRRVKNMRWVQGSMSRPRKGPELLEKGSNSLLLDVEARSLHPFSTAVGFMV